MEMFVVRGGNPISGLVTVNGSKNAALPIMAASLMAEGTTILSRVPELVDVSTLSTILELLGVRTQRLPDATLQLEVRDEENFIAEYEMVRRMRAGFCVLGPLLAKRGRGIVSLPGGCNIGDRPIDLHLKGLRALGAEIRVERGYVIAEAKYLKGASIYLGGPFGSSVTGTCNVMSAAVLAEGTTSIEAAACEPEVVDFGKFLNAMGANISGLGTPFLKIEGVESLHGIEYEIIPDRIEAATLMIAAAVTGGCLELEGVELSHMTAVIEKLREIGLVIERSKEAANTVKVSVPDEIKAADCIALPYPGIPTDVQAQMMTLLCLADGISVVTDKVFPDRFMHAAELSRMGARIRREGSHAVVMGNGKLSGACVMASDLRASAALVLAALTAVGETVIRRIYHLDRGYESLDRKLNSLNAQIARVEDIPANIPVLLALNQDERIVPMLSPEENVSGQNWTDSSPAKKRKSA